MFFLYWTWWVHHVAHSLECVLPPTRTLSIPSCFLNFGKKLCRYFHISNSEQVKVGDCVLPCSSELFCFPTLKKPVKVKICEAWILPIVLYGYETWSLTLWEEYGLKVFRNRVLREIPALIGGHKMGLENTVCWGYSWFLFSLKIVQIFKKNKMSGENSMHDRRKKCCNFIVFRKYHLTDFFVRDSMWQAGSK